MRKAFIAAILAAPLLLAPGAAEAWTGLQDAPYPVWGSMPVKYYVNQATLPPGIAATATKSLDAGFASWGAPDCTFFETQNMGNTKNSYSSDDYRNVLLWINKPDPWPGELGDVNSVIGVTLPVWQGASGGSQIIYDADIVFNNVGFCWYDIDPQKPGVTCSGGSPVDTQSIATHEEGHFLGLGHTDASGATMEPFYPGGNAIATIEQDDSDGVCALYPVGGAAATSGSSGGGVSCDVCRQGAAKNECAAETKACTGQCIGIYNCVLGCATIDDACIKDCGAKFPEGLDRYLAYANCACEHCANECSAQCGGNASGSTGGEEASGAWNGDDGNEGPQLSQDAGCGCATNKSAGHASMIAALAAGIAALARRKRHRP